jgi:CubicO group peptidase (beta-lactamase class C family)
MLCALVIAAGLSFHGVQADPASKVDAVFARWTSATPGCAVGVASGGKTVLERAYGAADLEHDVPNAPDTIFEAGSVSKQFTAAAVLLLARDGRLSLDDPVSKYVPELPDYGAPITLRQMLTHTSGLRDWGSIQAIAGWPRTTRAYTHAHVLDILSRQKAINFPPGTQWSYSNSGYNLAAIVVSRVAGKPFAEFTAERIFRPLGMTRTSWRDDFTRVVKHRAIAYDRAADGYHQNMPFENVHGNGGLLTTVGDLLRWNANFDTPVVGDAALVKEQQTRGRFNDRREHNYGFGLTIGSYRGAREVSHSGTTASYQAFLVRYPDQGVSVAVLCNAGDASATQFARAVAEVYLGSALAAPPAAAGGRGGPPPPFQPARDDLKAYVGRYTSGEAETEFTIAEEGDGLVLKQRPASVLPMRPAGKDVFTVPRIGTVTFLRDASGKVAELSVRQDRVWDLRFQLVRFPQ